MSESKKCRCGCDGIPKYGDFVRGHACGRPSGDKDHLNQRREYNRAYYAKNKDKEQEKNLRYKSKHRQELASKARSHYEENRDEQIKRHKEWKLTNTGYERMRYAIPSIRIRKLVDGAKRRAKRDGVPFDESLRNFLSAAPSTLCECCGSALDYSSGRGHLDRDHSPSLDRIEPSRGYVIGNIIVICWRCNVIKRDASLVEIENIRTYMRRHLLRNAPFKPYAVHPSSPN